MAYIDFLAVKEAVSIEDAIQRLGLTVRKAQHQLRGACPACKSGGDRALAITPAKNLYYCFAASAGGDQLQLVTHVKGISVRDAAEWLMGGPAKEPTRPKDANTDGFPPLDYLDADHEAVVAVGFEPEAARAIGIGYAPKGILRGTVAVPVRLEDGTLAGYIGIIEAKLPNKWHLPASNIVQLKKPA